MSFFRINDVASIPWYQHLCDLMLLVVFLCAVGYSVRAFRRGRREYVVLVVTAFFYGLLLELSGMIWHKSYVQGEFLVMLGFKQLGLFADSTDMPAYVPIFYPSMLFLGYKLVEAFGVARPAHRAVAGGFIMGLLDAPYIIQGGLPHVVWWTWQDWWLYQLWVGWPVVDLWWHVTWHATIFWLVYRLMPRVDGWYTRPGAPSGLAHAKALVALPLAIAVGVNVVCPVLHAPLIVATKLGGQQYPLVALLVLTFGAVFLLAPKSPHARVEPITLVAAGVYIASMAAMVVGNVRHEGRFTEYILVQSVALFALAFVLAYPALARRAREAARSGSSAGIETTA